MHRLAPVLYRGGADTEVQMKSKSLILGLMLIMGGVVSASAATEPTPVPQDPEVLRFASRVMPWHPTSKFEVGLDEKHMTPSGSYRLVLVKRTGAKDPLNRSETMLIDETANEVWVGNIGRLPTKPEEAADPEKLKAFVSKFIPETLLTNMRMRSKVSWDVEKTGAAAVIPFNLDVETGYGAYRRIGGITIDGKFVMLGAPMPYDRDPVAYRREVFEKSPLVMWDHEDGGGAQVRIVEFSDFECPACRAKWPLIKNLVKKYPEDVLHGMVNLPLPSIHPWAFRAASAAWCVARMSPSALPQLKETFYGLQEDMETSLVTPTAVDFVVGQGMDEQEFRDCYLKPVSIEAIRNQMALGDALGIFSTPTYFFNGWLVQAPDAMILDQLMKALLAGEEP